MERYLDYDEGLMAGREDGIEIGEKRGKKIGEKNGKKVVARKLLLQKVDEQIILSATGLSKKNLKN